MIRNKFGSSVGASLLVGLLILGCGEETKTTNGSGGSTGSNGGKTSSGGSTGSNGGSTAGTGSGGSTNKSGGATTGATGGSATGGAPGTGGSTTTPAGGSTNPAGGTTGMGGTPGTGGAVGGSTSTPGTPGLTPTAKVKARVIATTDGELDDTSSMNRFLAYASDYDIEGFVQVNGVQKSGHSRDKWIEKQIGEYEKCLPNFKKHRPDYPDAAALMAAIKVGNENASDLNKAPPLLSDNEGAQHIIKSLLDVDPRPIHILAWGGANTQANALWQIKTKRTPEEYKQAMEKVRLYCIWYQDGGGSWIESNLPEAKIYEAGSPGRDASWRYVWDYMSVSGKYKGRNSVNPAELQKIMDSPWLTANVKSGHGALGAAYTQGYTSEGDTPSFMPLIDNGLEHHTDYTLGGWGGRAVYANGNHMEDGADDNGGKADAHYTFQRWLPAAQNDWASRNDWCVATDYESANHQPDAQVAGGLERAVAGGSTATLDASPTTDPDGNELTFKWWQYHEADTASAKVTITTPDAKTASFVVPSESGKQVHIILEVTDKGSPPLTRYQRVIFKIN